ncbi:MAG: lipid-A-disaccharide synthase, partial [Deltaproteobacteria bacterium]
MNDVVLRHKNVMIIAGEASGDFHGANLMNAMRKLDPSLSFSGIGGNNMKVAGGNLICDISLLAVIGITDVVKQIIPIVRAFNKLKKLLKTNKPDIVILIDYPGFNLRFAKIAKKAGCTVLYYITPKIWAWGAGRINSIKNSIDMACVIFPFEEKIFSNAGVPVSFVGNPLIDCVRPNISKNEALKRFGLDEQKRTIVLLPGSRKSEIKMLLPEMLNACKLLLARKDNYQFVLALAATISSNAIKDDILFSGLDIK